MHHHIVYLMYTIIFDYCYPSMAKPFSDLGWDFVENTQVIVGGSFCHFQVYI